MYLPEAPMEVYPRINRYAVLLILAISSHLDLVSTGGYSCNCDCGPNAGGGRCSLLLPSVEYLKSGGTCQAIQLADKKQQCFKNLDAVDETVCWSMPRTACMCREPAGNYNLMCECDGNRGIFCGSEQNNCVCEVLTEDRNIGITIGIGIGASILGIFILTFLITAIYFIRQAQREKDPWYQFDKQFKKFVAIKEKEKAAGIRRPARTRALPSAPVQPIPSSSAVASNIETNQLLVPTTDGGTDERQRKISQTSGANWTLASNLGSTDHLEVIDQSESPKEQNQLHPSTRTELSSSHLGSTQDPSLTIYASNIALLTPMQRKESAVVHTALVLQQDGSYGYDNDIYESLD